MRASPTLPESHAAGVLVFAEYSSSSQEAKAVRQHLEFAWINAHGKTRKINEKPVPHKLKQARVAVQSNQEYISLKL
jgi:hypothetical protein